MMGSRSRFATSGAAAQPRRGTPSYSARSLAISSRFQLSGTWETSNSSVASLKEAQPAVARASAAAPKRATVRLGNKATGGPFAPLVVVVRNAIGEKEFNKLRGQAISAHSQIIKEFGKTAGVDNKQVQGVVRLAKKNGEFLGFLA